MFLLLSLIVVSLILTPSLLKCAQLSRLQEVSLDVGNSFLSWWKITHFDPQERLEHDGQPISVSFDYAVPVVTAIKHDTGIFFIHNVFRSKGSPELRFLVYNYQLSCLIFLFLISGQ